MFGLDFARAEWVSRGPQRTHLGLLSIPIVPFSLETFGQKFMDPWVLQGGLAAEGGSIPPSGLAQDPSANAAQRVDAMLAYAAGPAGTVDVVGLSVLADLGETLRQRADAEALKLRQGVWRGWDAIIEKSGGTGNFYVAAGAAALKWLTGTFDPSMYGATAKAKWTVLNDITAIIEAFQDSAANGLVYPWHAMQLIPTDVPKLAAAFKDTKNSTEDFVTAVSDVVADTSDDKSVIALLDSIAEEMQRNNQKMRALPQPMQDASQKFMGMLLAGLSDPFTARIFKAFPSGAWGARNLATDEQVIVVAAAVANQYSRVSGPNLSVRDLAIRLYEESPGWSGHPSLLSHIELHGDKAIPTNASQIQWGDLAQRAIAIAEGDGGSTTTTTVLTVAGVGLGLGLLAWVLL